MSRRKKEEPDGMEGEEIEWGVDTSKLGGETVAAYYYNGRRTMTVTFRRFVGKLPKVGGWAMTSGGTVSLYTEEDDGEPITIRGFFPKISYQADPDLDGNWLIEGVEILNDHVELKLIQYD